MNAGKTIRIKTIGYLKKTTCGSSTPFHLLRDTDLPSGLTIVDGFCQIQRLGGSGLATRYSTLEYQKKFF
jgi:hypothetical protein